MSAPATPTAAEPGFFENLGSNAIDLASTAGGMTLLGFKVLHRMVTFRFDGMELVRNLERMGVRSIPIVIVTALFTGAIMVLQAAPLVQRFGAHGLLGWGAGFGILREVAPLLTALMINGRVGANNTAELGTMVVTEQVDALRALAIEPLHYLVAPRVLAMVVMLFLLTALGDLFALIGGAITSELLLDVPMRVFIQQVVDANLVDEYLLGLVKGSVFGLSIAIVSCHFGLSVSGGAVGVGRAVNNAVVVAAIGIFVTDLAVGLIWNFL